MSIITTITTITTTIIMSMSITTTLPWRNWWR